MVLAFDPIGYFFRDSFGVNDFTEPIRPSGTRACVGGKTPQNNTIYVNGSNISIGSKDVRQQTSFGPATWNMFRPWDDFEEPGIANGNGGCGSNRWFPPSGGGGRGRNDWDFDDDWDFEKVGFWPSINFADVRRKASEAARAERDRSEFFRLYFDFHMGLIWPLGFLMSSSTIRNGMLDLFKIVTEVLTDSCSATFAEFQKKGKNFWSGFKIFAADPLIGLILDVALVGTLATYAHMGPMPSVPGRFFWQLQLAFASLPSRFLKAGCQGVKFALQQQIATYFYKGILFGAVGFGCGVIHDGIVDLIMTGNRNTKKSQKDTSVSDMGRSAALCGVILAVQSSPLAKRFPSVALAYIVGIGFAKMIYGGLQLSDWAKWSVPSCTLLFGFLLFLL